MKGDSARPEGYGLYRRLAAGGSVVFLLRAAGLALRFVTILLFARWIRGQAQFGAFALGLTWAQVLGVGVEFGFPTAVQRYIPQYLQQHDWDRLRGIISHSSRTVLAHGVLLIGVGLAGGVGVRGLLGHSLPLVYPTALILTLVMALANLKRDQLASFMIAARSHGPPMIVQPLVALTIGWCWYSKSGELTGADGLIAYLTGWVAVLTLQELVLRREIAKYRCKTKKYEKEWRTTATPLAVVAGLFMVLTRTDIIVLGAVRGAAAAGIYAVAARLATLSLLVIQSIVVLVQPTFARLHAESNLGEINEVYRWTSRVGGLAAGLLFLIFLFFGRSILGLIGEPYEAGWIALCVLSAGHLAMAFIGPASNLMMMVGLQRRVVRISGPFVAVNAALNVCMCWAFGLTGSAVATSSTNVMQNLRFRLVMMAHVRSEREGEVQSEQ